MIVHCAFCDRRMLHEHFPGGHFRGVGLCEDCERDDIIAAVDEADLCCPAQVADAVLAAAERGDDWRAELARAVARDPAERGVLGIDG